MLFGHPEYWDQLSTDEHELLHALPAPYGPLVAWLERDHSEHGPRPWAVLSHALRDDPRSARRRWPSPTATPTRTPPTPTSAAPSTRCSTASCRRDAGADRPGATDPARCAHREVYGTGTSQGRLSAQRAESDARARR